MTVTENTHIGQASNDAHREQKAKQNNNTQQKTTLDKQTMTSQKTDTGQASNNGHRNQL